ncbi:MAG: (Fe-S)-binding protein [Thermodesulfobacteriota bacterium]
MSLDYSPEVEESSPGRPEIWPSAPLRPGPALEGVPVISPEADLLGLTRRQVDYCMECGVCTGSCPLSRVDPSFSPRLVIKRTLLEQDRDLLAGRGLWACLSCARCSARCPAEIDFPELCRLLRQRSREAGYQPQTCHYGLFQTIARLQIGLARQRRTGWAAGAGTFCRRGDYFYFVGCLPYMEVVFRYLDLHPLDSARSVLYLLNRLGVAPVLSEEECCCGHDAYWSGDEAVFLESARRNLAAIRSSGARKVLFSCPECYHVFKHVYPRYFGELDFEVVHLSEFLAARLPGAGVVFTPGDGSGVTYHDPCRLGRLSGLYDPPRALLGNLPGTDLLEMERNRENAYCCGTSAWMECSAASQAIQWERLAEASRTGAGTLITACPKCRIHLTCAEKNRAGGVAIEDLYTYLAARTRRD